MIEVAGLVREVKAALTDDLRKPKYQGSPNPMTGHCYVASEALFHLLRENHVEGWHPMHLKHEGEPHWFLRHESGMVLDATAEQFRKKVPYDEGRGKGFLTAFPSKRAEIVLQRVRGSAQLRLCL